VRNLDILQRPLWLWQSQWMQAQSLAPALELQALELQALELQALEVQALACMNTSVRMATQVSLRHNISPCLHCRTVGDLLCSNPQNTHWQLSRRALVLALALARKQCHQSNCNHTLHHRHHHIARLLRTNHHWGQFLPTHLWPHIVNLKRSPLLQWNH